MHATDIVGWTNGTGCVFCADCEPEACDEKAPVFAGNEGWQSHTCDGCGEPLDPDYVAPNAIEDAIERDGCAEVSSATLRPQDLIPAFLDALRTLAPAACEQVVAPGCGFSAFPSYAQEDTSHEWWQSEACDDLLASLTDALEEHAPDGFYFGSNEGDGASFGFWPCEVDE